VDVGQWIMFVASQLQSAQLFYGHGTDNPADEAAWLVLHALGASPDGSFSDWNRPLTARQERSVREVLSRRIGNREPLAYILGSAWFAGLEFEVNPSVLVPRSPIAELILERFAPWMDESKHRAALDLGTGSGCIGVAMAWHMPWLEVDAADISQEALSLARRNMLRHGVESRVRLFHSDLFDGIPTRPYDFIVTNPPYVPRAALESLPNEYRAEPELGLVSGADGLDACLQIMLQSPAFLQAEGLLICEVGESEQRLAELFPTVPFLWLEFSQGGSGVFLLSRQQLIQSSAVISKVIEERSHVR